MCISMLYVSGLLWCVHSLFRMCSQSCYIMRTCMCTFTADDLFLLRLEVIYAVNEVCDYNSQNSGSVTAMTLDKTTGALRVINRVSSGGGQPVFASIDPFGKYLAVATYAGGNLSVLAIDQTTGTLSEPIATYMQGPGSHSVYIRSEQTANAAAKIHVFAPVFGSVGEDDKVDQYEMDPQTGALSAVGPLTFADGMEPRHMAFDDKSRFAYIANEGSADSPSRITQCYLGDSDTNYEGYLPPGRTANSTECRISSTIPPGMDPTDMYPSGIKTTRGGGFVLVSNRDATDAGRDSIAVFKRSVDVGVDGLGLTAVGYFDTGHYPRSFALNREEVGY